MQRKPHDRRAVPLNSLCHRGPGGQHDDGDELRWWKSKGVVEPLLLADRYYTQYRRENPNAPAPYVKGPKKVKARKPRPKRAKIVTYVRSWPKRTIVSRKIWR